MALLRAVHAEPVYFGYIGTIHIHVLIIRVSMIIQVSLQIHAKAHFGTMTKCVDYVGVLIFKYPD